MKTKTIVEIRSILVMLACGMGLIAHAQQETLLVEVADTLAADSTDLLLTDTLFVDAQTDDNLPLSWPQNVQQGLDRLMQSKLLQTTQVGLAVYDLDADSLIYADNDRQTMRPASCMKVLTAIAALDQLGGDHRFNTELLYTGTIEGTTLRGNVYCRGGFDPAFGGDDLNAFVESLRQLGVDTIRGRLCADKSMKDKELLGEGWCWDDDNPVLSPLLVGRKDVFLERFERELRRAGIVIQGATDVATCPRGATSICHRFHTMEQVLMRMMKQSDNLYAESMFYQLAAASGNRPATAKHAAAIEKRLIAKLGLQPAAYRIADGSGLSLYNYVSAQLLVRMLRHAYANDNIYENLLPSLPQAGIDGTLRNRMKGTAAQGRVQAKTGTVSGISSLAGYATAANGHRLAFAIINQGVMSARMGRDFQDRVCVILCK